MVNRASSPGDPVINLPRDTFEASRRGRTGNRSGLVRTLSGEEDRRCRPAVGQGSRTWRIFGNGCQ